MALPRWMLIGVVLVVVASACASDDGGGDSGATTTSAAAVTSTTETPTTAVATTTGTTGAEATTSTTVPEVVVEVYFSVGDGTDCAEVAPYERVVAASVDPVRAAFEALVAGPTAGEAADGASSPFSVATASAVRSVAVDEGFLLLDLDDVRDEMPNASTSCGSAALLAQIGQTGFQFGEVERIRVQFDRSCDVFANWLQRDCFDLGPGGDELAVSTVERASGSGCSPSSPLSLGDGAWFGYVTETSAGELGFDLACWFTGPAAVVAAEEDRAESPPPNDYHVRNDSSLIRFLPVDPSASIEWLPRSGDPSSAEVVRYVEWIELRADRPDDLGVWVEIENGRIVALEEQYVP